MTGRAAQKVCSKENKSAPYDVDFGHAPHCRLGKCPCEAHQEALVRPSLFIRLGQLVTFQKDTSAACVGCPQEGQIEVQEDGREIQVCDFCYNRKPHEKMVASMEALGGVSP